MAKMTIEEYGKLLKDIRVANQRIQRLQARYGESSWAVNKLYEKIDNEVIKGVSLLTGNIRVSKNMSETQLKAIQKATDIFLHSQTSTLRGVKKAINNMQESIKVNFSDMNKQISDRDAEKLYSFLENKELRRTTENIGASTVWANTIRAKEQNLSEDQFINLFKNGNIDINDLDVRDDLETIYKTYME